MPGRAASISTLGINYLFQGFGTVAGFLAISGMVGAAAVLMGVFVAETKPAKYED